MNGFVTAEPASAGDTRLNCQGRHHCRPLRHVRGCYAAAVDWFCVFFPWWLGHPADPAQRGQYAVIVQGNNGIEFSRNADDMIAPASTMKVLTALAARLEFGADFRFATDIQAQSGAKRDAINGDIWINFVGDPTLSRMDLVALFKQLGVSPHPGQRLRQHRRLQRL